MFVIWMNKIQTTDLGLPVAPCTCPLDERPLPEPANEEVESLRDRRPCTGGGVLKASGEAACVSGSCSLCSSSSWASCSAGSTDRRADGDCAHKRQCGMCTHLRSQNSQIKSALSYAIASDEKQKWKTCNPASFEKQLMVVI